VAFVLSLLSDWTRNRALTDDKVRKNHNHFSNFVMGNLRSLYLNILSLTTTRISTSVFCYHLPCFVYLAETGFPFCFKCVIIVISNSRPTLLWFLSLMKGKPLRWTKYIGRDNNLPLMLFEFLNIKFCYLIPFFRFIWETGKSYGSIACIRKIAASVLLTMFINVNEKISLNLNNVFEVVHTNNIVTAITNIRNKNLAQYPLLWIQHVYHLDIHNEKLTEINNTTNHFVFCDIQISVLKFA